MTALATARLVVTSSEAQRAAARRILAAAQHGDRVFVRTDAGATVAGRVTLKHAYALVIQPERDRFARPLLATEENLV